MPNKPTKIYGLVLESAHAVYLSVQSANSLEEAAYYAMEDFIKENPGIKKEVIKGAKIGLFSFKEIDDILKEREPIKDKPDNSIDTANTFNNIFNEMNELMETAEKMGQNRNKETTTVIKDKIKISPKEEKNKIMQQIIETKDTERFESEKSKFSKEECMYIKERLK